MDVVVLAPLSVSDDVKRVIVIHLDRGDQCFFLTVFIEVCIQVGCVWVEGELSFDRNDYRFFGGATEESIFSYQMNTVQDRSRTMKLPLRYTVGEFQRQFLGQSSPRIPSTACLYSSSEEKCSSTTTRTSSSYTS